MPAMTSASQEPAGDGTSTDAQATAASPGTGGESGAEVQSTGGMASGSGDGGMDAGYVGDDRLPEDLQPGGDELSAGDRVDDRTLAEGATEQAGQMPQPSERLPDDEPGVSEPPS